MQTFASSLGIVRGRISRARWWVWQLALIAITIVLYGMLLVGGLAQHGWDFEKALASDLLKSRAFTLFSSALIILDAIAVVWVSALRFHDRNRPGILAATWLLVTIFAVAGTFDSEDFSVLDGVSLFLQLLITIWFVIELGCMQGTVGPNQYGPDPLALKRLAAYPLQQSAAVPQPYVSPFPPPSPQDAPTRPGPR